MAVSNLSPWQQFLSTKFPGKNAKFTDAQLRAAADEFFGPIPIPPGATIISQDGGQVVYRDAEGYPHTASRSLDGRDPNAGVVKDNTSRPNILPSEQTASPQQQQLQAGVGGLSEAQLANLQALSRGENPAALDPGISGRLSDIDSLTARLQNPAALAQLDPQTVALLDQINKAEQARLGQQFDQDQSTLIANLYGNRVNQSSIAGQNAAQLLQSQGLVSQQQQADDAMRRLQTQTYLTDAERANLQLSLQGMLGATGAQLEGFQAQQAAAQGQANSWLDLLKSLQANQTQRDIAGAQIGLGDRELASRDRATNLNFELGQQDADMRLAASNSTFNKIMAGLNTAANLAGAVGGGISAVNALRNTKRTTPNA